MTEAGGQVVLSSAGRKKLSESASKISYRVTGVATTLMNWKAVLMQKPPYMEGQTRSVHGSKTDKPLLRYVCSQPYSEPSRVGWL
jgi:hypothetical protein